MPTTATLLISSPSPSFLSACSSSHLPLPVPSFTERYEGSLMKKSSGEEEIMKKSSGVGGGEDVAVLREDGVAKKGQLDAEAAGDDYDDRGPARTAEMLLRLAPMGLCLAALVIMLKNAQENDYGSISYADLTPFRYLVYANGVCAAYSLISAFYTVLPRPSTLSRSWAFFFFDQVLTYVILAAGAVSAEVMYLAYKGDAEVTWSRECGVFDSFCHRATTSVGITFGSVLCYVLLSLISSYRLFSNYEAPISALSNKDMEVAAFPR